VYSTVLSKGEEESPTHQEGHGESIIACALTLVRRGEYRAQTGIWQYANFVSVRTIKGASSSGEIELPSVRVALSVSWFILRSPSHGVE
jgi:hypothetical protein